MNPKLRLALAFVLLIAVASAALPEGFVDASEVVPELVVELKYATNDNFVGEPVDGYLANRAILTGAAANALCEVQRELLPQGLGLKVFDAYRPQRAVQHFVRWAQVPSPSARAQAHHPGLTRRELFAQGYLALDSDHTRGIAVDLTLVKRQPDGRWSEVDMGTPFDFFSPASGGAATDLSPAQRHARSTLRALMMRHGFRPSTREWWHFTFEGVSGDIPPGNPNDFPIE